MHGYGARALRARTCITPILYSLWHVNANTIPSPGVTPGLGDFAPSGLSADFSVARVNENLPHENYLPNVKFITSPEGAPHINVGYRPALMTWDSPKP